MHTRTSKVNARRTSRSTWNLSEGGGGEGGGRALLVTLAGEIGGRWSIETANFLKALAIAKARDATNDLQACVELAWFCRWSTILSCAAARPFADSLPEVRVASGAGGDDPSSNDVVWDNRF